MLLAARVQGEVALHGDVDLRGGRGPVGTGGLGKLVGQPEGEGGHLAAQDLVEVLALLDPDQLGGQEGGGEHRDRQRRQRDKRDADVEGVPHSSTSRYPARRTVWIRSAPILRRRWRT